jgi:mannitol/fructose-specific phosphotransferase system IIA component (Ntr-type)
MVTELPAPAAIDLHLRSRTRDQVLTDLVGRLAENGRVAQPQALLEALLERERLGSTGIGHGVAVPHCRMADVPAPLIALGRTDHEVDVDAIDGQPARLFFMLIAPEGAAAVQVQLLARIARLMRDAEARHRLMVAETVEQALGVILGNSS